MISDEERREVARRLRELPGDSKEDGRPLMGSSYDLTDVLESCKKAIGFSSVKEMPDALMKACENNDMRMFESFADAVPDLERDWLQMVFQYYLADRKGKMQDYSPASLGDLVSSLARGDSVMDMCAGSGALTIRCWLGNKSRRFVCVEYDERAIALLLFNLAIRNISAVVVHGDVLTQEAFSIWTLTSGERFSRVDRGGEPFECDCCISNPPYNMKWRHPDFAAMQGRFAGRTVPPESNANYAFVLSAMDKADRGVFILPNGVLSSSKAEGDVRRELVEDNWFDTVIACPDGMFESTSIPVCVVVLDKRKETASIEMVDARESHEVEVRDQRGQFGSKSHTSRVYHKEVSVFSESNIREILSAIENRSEKPGFSAPATIERVRENEYVLTPSRYVGIVPEERKHRPYEDIIADYNRVAVEKGGLKLTINETLARSIGLDSIYELQQQGNEIAEQMEEMLSKIVDGCKIEKPVYIRLSKNKNEIKFENGNKDALSEILLLVMQQWKAKLYYLNNQENALLAELRDALLPDLMSGKIELP